MSVNLEGGVYTGAERVVVGLMPTSERRGRQLNGLGDQKSCFCLVAGGSQPYVQPYVILEAADDLTAQHQHNAFERLYYCVD